MRVEDRDRTPCDGKVGGHGSVNGRPETPRVFEIAAGEIISFEDVGAVDVLARKTGQIDLENPAIRSYVDELRAPSPALAPIIDLRGRGSGHGFGRVGWHSPGARIGAGGRLKWR